MIYTSLTKKALKLSFAAHRNQLDKGGIPYIYHPYHLAEQMQDEYSVCVALLHDVMEDTDMTWEELEREGFPDEVMEAVRCLTRLEGMSYPDYIRGVRKNALAAKVKLADLQHNSDLSRLDCVDEAARERLSRYRQAIRILKEEDLSHS